MSPRPDRLFVPVGSRLGAWGSLFAALLMVSASAMDSAHFVVAKVLDDPTPDTAEMTMQQDGGDVRLLVDRNVALTDRDVVSAEVPAADEVSIRITLNAEGQKKLAALTGAWKGKRLAIVLDGQLVSAPSVMEQITGGTLVISGKMTKDFAAGVVAAINQGARGR